MKKKVLFVISNLKLGGAQKSLVSLLSLLNYKEIEVDLLILNYQGELIKQVPKEVNIIRLSKESEFFLGSNIRVFFHFIREFKIIESLKILSFVFKSIFGMFNSHDSQRLWSYRKDYINNLEKKYCVAIGYLQSTPVYYVVDKVKATKKIAWFHSDYKAGGYNKKIDYPYFKKVDNIITVSERASQILKDVFYEFPEKIDVIKNIVSIQTTDELESFSNSDFDDRFDGLKILSVGRLDEVKGYDIQIDVAEMLFRKGYKFRWYVIGAGNKKLKTKLKKKLVKKNLQNTFVFLGSKPNPYPYYKKCDIYVQTSRYESFCIAVAEAKAFNRPIVSTDFTGIREQLENGVTGLIVPMDSQEICKAVKKLMDNSELRNSLKENLTNSNIEENQKNIIDKFNELLN